VAALLAMLLLAARTSGAGASDVVGAVSSAVVAKGDSLIELARDHGLGFNEIAAANQGLDAYVPRPGATVVLPTQWIVPRAARRGELVVNLSELRLYLLPRDGGAPLSFPVGIAVEANATPLGTARVIARP
jgi:L,D-transpeptidase ErfK/SrfK